MPDPEIELARHRFEEICQEHQFELEQALIEAHILNEAKGGQWYTKWKLEVANSIRAILATTMNWANSQIPNDNQFINANRDVLFNLRDYPPKSTGMTQSVPDYAAAIQRISVPLSTNLRGFDLNKIEDDKKGNIAFKKAIIASYNGSRDQGDFASFARNYFYGADNRKSITQGQLTQIIQSATQYVQGFQGRLTSAQTDVNGILNYINQDPGSVTMGNQQSDLQKLAASQYNTQMAQAAGQASTNPGANVVNASYEYFMEEYFGELNEAVPVMNQKTINGNKPVQATTPASGALEKATAKSKQTPNGAPVDPPLLALNRKKIAVEIVRDALAAKLAAMGMVYRDMVMFMRTHVASYKGPQAANIGNNPKQAAAPPLMQNPQRPM